MWARCHLLQWKERCNNVDYDKVDYNKKLTMTKLTITSWLCINCYSATTCERGVICYNESSAVTTLTMTKLTRTKLTTPKWNEHHTMWATHHFLQWKERCNKVDCNKVDCNKVDCNKKPHAIWNKPYNMRARFTFWLSTKFSESLLYSSFTYRVHFLRNCANMQFGTRPTKWKLDAHVVSPKKKKSHTVAP